MILKEIDNNKTEEIKTLKNILNLSNSDKQKFLIRSNLTKLESGLAGEKETAYFIDFNLKDSGNYAVLHDLRFEFDGQTAQIDHLLINKVLGIILVETKNTSAEVEIHDDGTMLYRYPNGKSYNHANPLEQSARHEIVLKKILAKENINLEINSYVVFLPNVKIINKKLPAKFLRADSFTKNIYNEFKKSPVRIMTAMAKSLFKGILTTEDITNVGNSLIQHHKPIKIDYNKIYKIKTTKEEEKFENSSFNQEPLIINNAEINESLINNENNAKKLSPQAVEKITNQSATITQNIPDFISTIHPENIRKFCDIKKSKKYMGNEMISFVCITCKTIQRKSLRAAVENEISCKACKK